MKYELCREVFNTCGGGKMRNVEFHTIETDNVDAYVANLFKGKNYTHEKEILEDGTIIINTVLAGLPERYTFTED